MFTGIQTNLNSKPDDLTQINFGDPKNSIEFRFVLSSDIEGKKNRKHFYGNPVDLIRFSTVPEVLDKIEEVARGMFLKPPSFGPIKCGYKHPVCVRQIPASESHMLFNSLKLLQESGSKISVPSQGFQHLLTSLNDAKLLTQSEVESLQKEIHTSPMLYEYKREAEPVPNNSFHKSLSLSLFYRNRKKDTDKRTIDDQNKSIYWLYLVKLQRGSLEGLIELDEFFKGFTEIYDPFLFYPCLQEVSDALARCETIINLTVNPDALESYPGSSAEMGKVIRESSSIKTLQIVRYSSTNPFPEGTFINEVANALQVNNSIEVLDIDGFIPDDKIIMILQGIQNNPKSKITKLVLDVDSKTVTQVLKELILAKPQIVSIDDDTFETPMDVAYSKTFGKF